MQMNSINRHRRNHICGTRTQHQTTLHYRSYDLKTTSSDISERKVTAILRHTPCDNDPHRTLIQQNLRMDCGKLNDLPNKVDSARAPSAPPPTGGGKYQSEKMQSDRNIKMEAKSLKFVFTVIGVHDWYGSSFDDIHDVIFGSSSDMCICNFVAEFLHVVVGPFDASCSLLPSKIDGVSRRRRRRRR
eukprot:6288182-Amphidinium_carterae.1